MQHHFSDTQIWPLYVALTLCLSSVILFSAGRTNWSLTALFIGTLGLGFFIANLDPFLLLWDEQYHALVAKSMLETPFEPKLYAKPLLEYDYRNWTGNSIWLHKQPLFLWPIALSLKFFGIKVLAVRLPSIVLHAVTVFFIYRIGKICLNDRIGYFAALFFAFAYYPLELVAGRYSTDHNDVAFLFYIAASFWAWFEYSYSRKSKFLFLIGLFAGCAVLVKWLVGLLIYACWVLSIGSAGFKAWLKIANYYPIFKSLLVSLIVFVPWQLYILSAFPNEANFEFAFNTRHFFEQIESHGGSVWYHFEAFRLIYGSGTLVPFFYGAGLFLLIKTIQLKQFRVAILSAIIINYGFYSAAATKMPSFSIIVSPFAFLSLACLVDWIISRIQQKIGRKVFLNFIQVLCLLTVSIFLLDLRKIQNYHTNWIPHDNCNREAELKQMEFIRKLKSTLGNEPFVVFDADVRMNGHIATMFFTNFIAYDLIPSEVQIESLRSMGYKIAIHDTGELPDYLAKDNRVIKISI
jgi:4-amino-4-deoxy-L-arabinose transferase-like glycosyltransferase